MQAATQSRLTPYHFEDLPSFTRERVVLWNWYSRVGPSRSEWTSWIGEIFGRLVERPAGQQLQLVQTHMVDAQFGEKTLSFGSKQELFIGRAEDSDVVLPAKAIANRHARLLLSENHVRLEDLGSRLGTYLWDKRLLPHEVQILIDGDQFSVFPYRFRVVLERCWKPETEISLAECRVQPLSRAEFLALSPAGWRAFVVNPHPSGERALLDIDPAFFTELCQRTVGPLGLEKAHRIVPSDDVILGFIMLALLERLNRRLNFPVQFSFARSAPKKLADATPGMLLSSAVNVGGLSGSFRIFLPLEFVTKCVSHPEQESTCAYPTLLSWRFPISAAFVDLSADEIAQVGLGDILVTETATQVLFPNDFNKGWSMLEDGSNSGRFMADNYFERSMSVETRSETAGLKPDVGALPLRLHVIVGEKEFTVTEIQSLNPGTIIELDASKSEPVRLMVNGKILGEGELVDVEGKLAVKVLGWRIT